MYTVYMSMDKFDYWPSHIAFCSLQFVTHINFVTQKNL